MTAIARVCGREILDCRGYPTVEVDVVLADGSLGRTSVQSGVTIGAKEAVDRRDGDRSRFRGRGVRGAVAAVNNDIAAAVVGMAAEDQETIDSALIHLDGTPRKSRLGANATLGVSIAVAQAAAAANNLPLYQYLGGPAAHVLPVPLMNLLFGGVHADNAIDFQEIMIAPVGAQSFAEAVQVGAEVMHALRDELRRTGQHTTTGDEGGFAPRLSTVAALQFLTDTIHKAGYEPGRDVALLVDAAAGELFSNRGYRYPGEDRVRSVHEHVAYLADLIKRFSLVSVEDPAAPDDLDGWRMITDTLGGRCQLVGDDIFCTNTSLLTRGVSTRIANSLLAKPSQIGTLTETMTAARKAQTSGYTVVMSHRSGETEDTTLADLAVALNCGQLKSGAPSRSDRTAKYNRLIRIEEDLGPRAHYPGASAFRAMPKVDHDLAPD